MRRYAVLRRFSSPISGCKLETRAAMSVRPFPFPERLQSHSSLAPPPPRQKATKGDISRQKAADFAPSPPRFQCRDTQYAPFIRHSFSDGGRDNVKLSKSNTDPRPFPGKDLGPAGKHVPATDSRFFINYQCPLYCPTNLPCKAKTT
jgi:hypothetical protein